ncbi:MAG: hypothetical protein NC041_10200 [Bacteroides sp.]|nr:hypothetical protein [Prevotella sp.]MCM1406847.1 hypothetical protein [Treponema brennaborense]MCM1470824.1 hypothetical protein [Bacteroides sp.]
MKNTDIFGRKSFFIAPDDSLVPLSYMEKFCTLGFETHIIAGGGRIFDSVEKIVRHFPDAVLFFDADAETYGVDLGQRIKALCNSHADLLAGVIYKDGKTRRVEMDVRFGGNVSPQVGCISLMPNDDGNFFTLRKVLEQIGAKGRRNYIRAACDEFSNVSFRFEGRELSAKIEDVNISHFRCVATAGDFGGMNVFSKIRDAHFFVNGLEMTSDLTLLMKRDKCGVLTAVFMFVHGKPEDLPGLESKLEPLLNKKIYQIISEETAKLLYS